MALLQEDVIYTALKGVRDPEINHSIVELGMVQEVEVEGDAVYVRIVPTSAHCPFANEIISRIKHAVAGVEGVKSVEVEWGGAG